MGFLGTGSYPLQSNMAQTFFQKSNQTVETMLNLRQNHEVPKIFATKPKKKLQRKVCKHKSIPAEEFIPIKVNSESVKSNNSSSVVKPIPKDPKLLRPIVIDGSNIAREHGKKNNTFSCKGIKLSIEYFLQRGHTQVTAFVPNFRRHCTFGPVVTTDQPILEDLARSGHVVFTPSRKVNGKRVTCYDDRFIVELASKTGGVILSNDNYKDLIGENESFKKTIEERLLMFCFVDDILMIPQDPLGRNGPCLEEYLSFPEDYK
ncbi:ribonuclease ZC3H12A-like [Uloborus diversus]|uniref:ribonuclease ZC3H12A-like n=1 Tax=Uloborus diversus TaxID=327109 RepID=UPI002409B93B|nr:ribonuclease ZC3H12A-like [Uloborus diversus]